jgi:LmbE family N-acetylglucosaminyl deacetylase
VTPPIAILSPHLDDAVLSCWNLLSGPGDVLVVNVFAGMPPPGAAAGWWDRLSGCDDPRAVVSERVAEDRAALALAGRQAINLDFLDRQYRPGRQAVKPLVAAVRKLLPTAAVVLGPGALARQPADSRAPEPGQGPHPDHVAARSVALALRSEGFEAGLYADLPHASAEGLPDWVADGSNGATGRQAAATWRTALSSTGLRPDELRTDVSRLASDPFARKLEAVRTYASQVAVIEEALHRSLSDPALLGYEVVWWLPPARRGTVA